MIVASARVYIHVELVWGIPQAYQDTKSVQERVIIANKPTNGAKAYKYKDETTW